MSTSAPRRSNAVTSRRIVRFGALAVTVALAAACGGGSGDGSADGTTTTSASLLAPTSSTTTTSAPAPPDPETTDPTAPPTPPAAGGGDGAETRPEGTTAPRPTRPTTAAELCAVVTAAEVRAALGQAGSPDPASDAGDLVCLFALLETQPEQGNLLTLRWTTDQATLDGFLLYPVVSDDSMIGGQRTFVARSLVQVLFDDTHVLELSVNVEPGADFDDSPALRRLAAQAIDRLSGR